jgi:hypothetical protein
LATPLQALRNSAAIDLSPVAADPLLTVGITEKGCVRFFA